MVGTIITDFFMTASTKREYWRTAHESSKAGVGKVEPTESFHSYTFLALATRYLMTDRNDTAEATRGTGIVFEDTDAKVRYRLQVQNP